MRTDHDTDQSGVKKVVHHSRLAKSALPPNRSDGSNTQTTLPWQVSRGPAAAPSAPPVYCLRNRSNFCYLNSVAVALHWSMISSGGSPRDFGTLGPALAVLSRLRTLELFTHATWKELLRGWRRPAQQHDATELMSFIMDPGSCHLFGEWQARCQEPDGVVICDRGTTSPFLSLDIRNQPSLGEATAAWHTQPFLHALSRTPILLAIQLGRFHHNGRRTVKVRTPCDLPTLLEFPVFQNDQLECSTRTYRLCGGIVHVGDLATSGHYRPFCMHNTAQSMGSEAASPHHTATMLGQYTLYDDDKPPSSRSPSNDKLLRHNTYVVFYCCTSREGRRSSESGS